MIKKKDQKQAQKETWKSKKSQFSIFATNLIFFRTFWTFKKSKFALKFEYFANRQRA